MCTCVCVCVSRVSAQIKHAKIARELEASTLHERVLSNRGEELEQEVQDVSSTCRARMRWLEHAAETARRRLEGLLRELQGAVPLTVSKESRLQNVVV